MERARALLANHPGSDGCGSVCERAIAIATARAAAITRTTALAFSLALALAPTRSLTLAGAVTDSVARTESAICLLALFLAGGAFRFGLRWTAESASAAALAALGERGACG